MQTTEHDEQQLQVTPADPQSQAFPPVSPAQGNDDEDDPDHIFVRAVAEIDTQPLCTGKRESTTLADVLEIAFLVSVLLFGLLGSAYLAITYPHTLVVLFTKAKPASITATLDLPTRILAPVTITRSATTLATGTGHQEATQATGTLMFYNGSATPQYVPGGSVLTGNDGVKITTEHSSTIPAANLPAIGSLPVQARAMLPGRQGNIASFDINMALSPVLKVRNEAPFSNGRDARTFRAVAPQDLTEITKTVNDTLTQALIAAFSLQPGEAALPTNCTTKTTANHAPGDEAQSVTVTSVKTCSAMAYNQDEFTRTATAAFTKMRPGAPYHLVGTVEITLKSVTPLTVALRGKWAYTFTQNYQELLAQEIQGDSPAEAKASLLKTGIISYASVPNTLPAAEYINFLVLVG